MSGTSWKSQPVEGGVLAFDRNAGLNVLVQTSTSAKNRRQSPRALQVGLLTPCNLACDFCYRDTAAPSRLTADFLVDLLTQAAEWGVLEVAFGGGEPLLFPGFASLVQRLHELTPLGINFTTNGTLLTPELLNELGDKVGEIRVSAYDNNDYRRTLKLLADHSCGLNLLATPANVRTIELIVVDALRRGAKNVMLLGYKGADARYHLSSTEFEILRAAIWRMERLPLRLDVCWYPLFPELPHLFPKRDCGAGDEFLVITPDRAIQPCSFHHERIPFSTFADLQRIYFELQSRRPPAMIGGCTRQDFVSLPPRPPRHRGAFGSGRHARATTAVMPRSSAGFARRSKLRKRPRHCGDCREPTKHFWRAPKGISGWKRKVTTAGNQLPRFSSSARLMATIGRRMTTGCGGKKTAAPLPCSRPAPSEMRS